MKHAPAPAASKAAVPFAIKAVNEQARTFRGLASTWEKDLGDDVIHRGAFARTIDHWRANRKSRPIPLIDQHSYYSVTDVLGGLIDAEETTDGLEAEFDFVPDDADAEKAYRRVKGGYITGLSIGYIPVRWEYEQKEGGESWERIRHLREVKLLEVSLVIWPMNEGARVDPASIKGLLDAARAGTLTPEQKAELRALLDAPPAGTPPCGAAPPAPEPKGLAPDDPKRLSIEERLRGITLRGLAA